MTEKYNRLLIIVSFLIGILSYGAIDKLQNHPIYAAYKPTLNVVTVTSTYTATIGDDVILANTSSGGFTINLASASSVKGHVYDIKKIITGSGTVTIDPAGSETIDNVSTKQITSLHAEFSLMSDGANWWIR